jgi:hypothetical protein
MSFSPANTNVVENTATAKTTDDPNTIANFFMRFCFNLIDYSNKRSTSSNVGYSQVNTCYMHVTSVNSINDWLTLL